MAYVESLGFVSSTALSRLAASPSCRTFPGRLAQWVQWPQREGQAYSAAALGAGEGIESSTGAEAVQDEGVVMMLPCTSRVWCTSVWCLFVRKLLFLAPVHAPKREKHPASAARYSDDHPRGLAAMTPPIKDWIWLLQLLMVGKPGKQANPVISGLFK